MMWAPHAAYIEPDRVFELVVQDLADRGIDDLLFAGFVGSTALYLPISAFDSHGYIVGPSRSGKTARALAPLLTQLIRFGKRVWVFDCKPDLALWGHLSVEAAKAGRNATMFSLYPGVPGDFSLDVFSDLADRSPRGVATHLMSALSLDGAKEQFFSDTNRACLSDGVDAARKKGVLCLKSLLKEILRMRRAYPHAQHALNAIQMLSREPMLNTPSTARTVESLASSDEVVYFCVPVASEAGEIGKAVANLVLRLVVLSQRESAIRGRPRERLYAAVDEFQDLATAGDIRDILAQASGHNVSLILSHQSKAQVQDRALTGELRQAGVQIDFSPIDDGQYWMERSGQVIREFWSGTAFREQSDFRIDWSDLNDVARTSGVAIVDSPHVPPDLCLPQAAYMPFHVSMSEAKRREQLFRLRVSAPASQPSRATLGRPIQRLAKSGGSQEPDKLADLYAKLKRETLFPPIH